MAVSTKAIMSVQLPLHIGLLDSATFANFYPAQNEQLIAELQRCALNQGEHFIFFHGIAGTGKSHCLQAVCHAASNHQLQATYLPMRQIHSLPIEMLEGLEQLDIVCIDDIELIAGDKNWEVAIFNLYNRIRDNGGSLIVTAKAKFDELGLSLKDLQSRLAWGLVFKIEPLNDSALATALQLRAKARGIDMPDEVIAYVLKHCEREMNTLFSLLEKLDRESLVEQRKLTIPFVKQYL